MPTEIKRELKQAFVIQAVGKPGTDTRARADQVFESVIKPACAQTGYQAARADRFDARTIVEPIISALNTHPLVVADLAAPPWNANVLMEIGFRLAIGRPIIVLADVDPTPDIIPLHLRNVRIHRIHPAAGTPADVEALVGSINAYGSNVQYWESHYPIIEFSISLTNPDASRFIYANQSAAEVYGLDDPSQLIGRLVDDVDSRLYGYIPEPHLTEFKNEQGLLFASVVKVGNRDSPTAKIPLWFKKHERDAQNDKIYWPVLFQHRFDPQNENSLVMRVAYIDISAWDVTFPRPRSTDEILRIPELFRRSLRRFRNDVFLSYNSADAQYVHTLWEKLTQLGLRVWYDTTDFGGLGGLVEDLMHESLESRVFVTVLGVHGLGRWQEKVELKNHLLQISRGDKPFMLLLLPEVGPDRWKSYVPQELALVLENQLRYPLPPAAQLNVVAQPGSEPTFVERLLRVFLQIVRSERPRRWD